MNKNYVSPKAEIKKFVSEDVVALSGVNTRNGLIARVVTPFANDTADVSWDNVTPIE